MIYPQQQYIQHQQYVPQPQLQQQEEKKSYGMAIFIVIIVLVGLGLICKFVIYDKIIKVTWFICYERL